MHLRKFLWFVLATSFLAWGRVCKSERADQGIRRAHSEVAAA